MEAFEDFVTTLSGFIWGGTWGDTRIVPVGPIAVILLGAGVFFMIRLGARPLRRLFPALGEVWAGRKGDDDPSTITPWQALSTALSGQVGTGNLAGVATAITLGGPGAIFWMWVTAFFGMALAFSESSLAIKYREKDEYGRINGGPMYYIKNGLGPGWTWLAVLFCIGTIFSATATGGMIQANSITQTVVRSGAEIGATVPNWAVGLVMSVLVFTVIIGGIRSIGSVAGKVVPVMALFYVACAFVVLVMNASEIPHAFSMIIMSAFGFEEALGGVAGYGMLLAVRAGIARGLFSNEAGQGSAPIAHAAAQTKNPVVQGEIAMIGVFIDTLVICTMTALVILTTAGTWTTTPELVDTVGATTTHIWQAAGLEASAITNEAYARAIPGGGWIVTIALTLFAFTTIIGWSYYAEQAATFLIGEWATKPFRYVWVVVIFIGALFPVQLVWMFGDLANASMAFPNLIAIIALSGTVLAIHRANGDPDTPNGESIMILSDKAKAAGVSAE
ncbi:MAG: sodium:alanine symporter family protein [Pseudomonadota bacterium]